MIEYFVLTILGLISGLLLNKISFLQISARTKDEAKIKRTKELYILPGWMLISALLFNLVCWKYSDYYSRIEYILYLFIILDIAFVDQIVRKIPNINVLGMFVVKIVFIAIQIFNGAEVKAVIVPSILGLGIGAVLFFIPSLFAKYIGAGDIKYCAAIGFCFGIYDFLQAMIIMAVAMLFLLIYLMATHKGNLKTLSAMGPYLSLGVIVTIIFPVVRQMSVF